MAGELEEAIARFEIGADGPDLVAAIGCLDRLTAKLSVAVGEFDASGLWELDDATSMTAWLRNKAGRTNAEAARLVSTARRLRRLPLTRAAWLEGTLSGSQVQAVVANVNDRTVDQFAAQEAALIPAFGPLTIDETIEAMRTWAAAADDRDPTEPDQSLRLSPTLDGRGRIDGNLDADTHATVSTALRVAETRDLPGEPHRSVGRRRADALGDICRFFLDNQQTRSGGRHRPHINVVIDLETLEGRGQGQLIDGVILTEPSIRRLLCDANIHRVVTNGRSAILNYGHTTHTVPAPLFNAVAVRDQHCRFPGCDRPPKWCEAHHVVHWTHGGPTNIANLVLLCSRHHHLIHRPGWQVELKPDAELHITRPDGWVLTSHPANRGSPDYFKPLESFTAPLTELAGARP